MVGEGGGVGKGVGRSGADQPPVAVRLSARVCRECQ